MPEVTVERRSAPRYAMVLAAEVVELPRGAKLNARTSDISRTGCYIDTLNPIPQGSEVRLRLTHAAEIFVTLGRVVYVSYGLGMGIAQSNWPVWTVGFPSLPPNTSEWKLPICKLGRGAILFALQV